jgi:hypothetical protein
MSRAAACLLALGLIGCAHRLTVEPAAPEPSPPVQRVAAPLVVEEVSAFQGRSHVPTNASFVARVLMELRRARAFTAVLPPEAASKAPIDVVRLRLVVIETTDEHYGPNVGRAIAVGVSLLTLAPFVRFDLSRTVEIRGELETCDGWKSEHFGSAVGHLEYAFLSNEIEARRELGRSVLEPALRAVLDQISSNEALATRVQDLAREDDCPKPDAD